MEKKIFIELEIQDDWPPCDTEWVWGEKLSNSLTLYQINNIPFFDTRISYKDIITTRQKDGLIWFDNIYQVSKYSVIEVVILEDLGTEKFNRFLKDLSIDNSESLLYEFAKDFLSYVIAINNASPFKKLEEYLKINSNEGVMEYDFRINRFDKI
jgi:hypothetical protein